MAFFKTKIEREMEAQMRRDEQMEVFNEQINELKNKRQEYAKIAAEAEVNNDEATYNTAVNALLEINSIVSDLMQTKANFDIINVSNSIATNMAMAVNALDAMANSKTKMPDLRKIQKANIKVRNYMKQINISQKAMGKMMKSANPANRVRSAEEISSVRPMIDAEISRLVGGATTGMKTSEKSKADTNSMDLSSEIQAEKNRII